MWQLKKQKCFNLIKITTQNVKIKNPEHTLSVLISYWWDLCVCVCVDPPEGGQCSMMLPSLSWVSVTDLTFSKAPASSSSAAKLILQLQRDTKTNSERFHSHRCSQVLISLRTHQIITIWCVHSRLQSGL